MRIHELKTDPEVYEAVASGRKKFEIRKNDRSFATGDILHLRKTIYTGAEMKGGKYLLYDADMLVKVTHILYGPIYGLEKDWCIMSIEKLV